MTRVNQTAPRPTARAAPSRTAGDVRSGPARSGVARSKMAIGESQSGVFERLGRMVLFVVAALGIAHITALILMSAYRHSLWSQQSELTANRVVALKSEVRDLEVRVAKARSDRSYLEELARRQGFVFKSERVIVPPVPPASIPVEDPAPSVPIGSGR